jgi:nucleoside-diphosphate-sugar epimerase
LGIYVVRAFVHLREAASVHADLAKRLSDFEMTTESLEISHDTFGRNTRLQLKQMLEAVRELMAPPEPPKRPIGYVQPEKEKPAGKARSKAAARRLKAAHLRP